MSAWGDLEAEENTVPGATATLTDEGQDSLEQSGGDDGFNSLGSEESFEDVEAVEPKKKGVNPKMVLAVLVVVTTTVLGAMGWTVYKKFQPQVAVAAPVESTPVDTVLLSDANGQAATALAQPDQTWTEPAAQADVPPVVAVPTESAPVVVAVPADVYQPAADDSALLKRMGEIDQRMNVVEGSLASLDSSIAQVKAAVAAKPVTARASASPRRSSSNKIVRAKAATPVVQVQADTTVMPLKLRGVYPPTGEDRQAWVLDPASGSIAVVSKGVRIGDSVVVRVDLDQIVTTRGIIR